MGGHQSQPALANKLTLGGAPVTLPWRELVQCTVSPQTVVLDGWRGRGPRRACPTSIPPLQHFNAPSATAYQSA